MICEGYGSFWTTEQIFLYSFGNCHLVQLFFVYFFRRNTLEFIFIVYTLDVVVCGYPTPFKFHPLLVQIPFFWMAKHIILYSLGNCQPTCSYFFVYFQFFTNIHLNLFSLLMPLMLWYVVYPTPFKFHPLFVQISFFLWFRLLISYYSSYLRIPFSNSSHTNYQPNGNFSVSSSLK